MKDNLSDEPTPRPNDALARALACFAWDFELWRMCGMPLQHASGAAVQIHPKVTKEELTAIFASSLQ